MTTSTFALDPVVLLADRDRSLLDAVRDQLGEGGTAVQTASSGVDCVQQLRALGRGIVVLDADLPWGGSDGVLAVIRENPGLARVRVVLAVPPRSPVPLDLAPPVVGVVERPYTAGAVLDAVRPAAGVDLDRRANPDCRNDCPPGIEKQFEVAGTAAPRGAGAMRPGGRAGDGVGVLIVEDDSSVRSMVRDGLRWHGFHTWEAETGGEAVALYRANRTRIAAVLLDVRLPGEDGPRILARLREECPNVVACFMSADFGGYTADELLRAGARRVFLKPFLMRDVAEQLSEVGLADRPPGCADL